MSIHINHNTNELIVTTSETELFLTPNGSKAVRVPSGYEANITVDDHLVSKKFVDDGFQVISAFYAKTNVANVWTDMQTFDDNRIEIVNDADPSKILQFELTPLTTGNTRVITMDDAPVDLADVNTALQPADIGVTVQGYDVDTAKLDVAQTWSGLQKIPDNLFNVVGSGDSSKILEFEVDSLTTSTTRTITWRDVAVDMAIDGSGSFAASTHTHTESDITDLQSYLLPADIGVTVQAYDVDTAKTDAAQTFSALQKFPDNLLNIVGSGDATKVGVFEVDSISTGVTRTITVPDSNVTLADIATSLQPADIGVTVQAYDVDTAKLDVVQVWTASQTHDASSSGLILADPADSGKKFGFNAANITTSNYRILTMDDANVDLADVNSALQPADIGVTVQGYDVDTAKLDVAQSFTAKQTFKDTLIDLVDDADVTKILNFQLTAIGTGTTKVISMPNANVDLADVNSAIQQSDLEAITGDVTISGTVSTISAGAVDVTMLANGTDGELYTWDAAGISTTVPVGAANDVLTSNGIGATPTFQGVPTELANDTSPVLSANLTLNGFDLIMSAASGIVDASGNSLLEFGSNAASINYFSLSNSITAVAPSIMANSGGGGDTNVSGLLSTKGTGVWTVASGTGNYEDNLAGDDDIVNKKYVDDNSGATQLSSLTDVTSAGITNKFALMADGSAYVGRALVEGDISDLGTYQTGPLTGDVTTSGAAATISAGAVDVTMLANGTDGELITWDAAGAPATVPVGTSGNVLTSNGIGAAPTFQASPAGATQLNELSDVVSATNTNKFALMANGTTGFVGRALVEADIGDLGAYITPSSTDTLTNKTFDANGTGNSLSNVDVADLSNATDGELITWDAAGAPTTVPVGTSGDVLTSNGVGAAPTFQAAAGGGSWTYGSQVATTSGTSWVLGSGLPAGITEIEVILNGCSTNANNVGWEVVIGDSGGYETSGYDSRADYAASISPDASTSDFQLTHDVITDAATIVDGVFRLTRWDTAEHLWIGSGSFQASTNFVFHCTGTKTLSGELTQLRLEGGGGTGDLGEARMRYR